MKRFDRCSYGFFEAKNHKNNKFSFFIRKINRYFKLLILLKMEFCYSDDYSSSLLMVELE